MRIFLPRRGLRVLSYVSALFVTERLSRLLQAAQVIAGQAAARTRGALRRLSEWTGLCLSTVRRLLAGRSREAFGVTVLTSIVVLIVSLLLQLQMTTDVVQEVNRQATLIHNLIIQQIEQALNRRQGSNPYEVVREDDALRRFLEATIENSPHLLDVLLVHPQGNTVLNVTLQPDASPSSDMVRPPERPNFEQLLLPNPIRYFAAFYREGTTYESTNPVLLNNAPFVNVTLGIHSSFLRGDIEASLKKSLTLAAITLPIVWLMTMGLATVTLRPLRSFARHIERFRYGDFKETADLDRTDEFQGIASQLRLLGQELQSDRLKTLNQHSDLRNVVDHLSDSVIVFSREHEVLFSVPAADSTFESLHSSDSEYLMRDIGDPTHPIRIMLMEVFEEDACIQNASITISHDGLDKQYLISAFCIKEQQNIVGAVVLFNDLESLKTLQALVRYSTELTAYGQLKASVAHEVRNPLNAIIIHLELLKEHVNGHSSDAEQSLEVIENEIRRLDRVVHGFLTFVRPQAIQLTSVDVNALLDSSVALLEIEWRRKGIRFASRYDRDLPHISADEELLSQVFLNLLLNACEAMTDGGTITIVTEEDGEKGIRISIADEGSGIAPEHQDKIFDLYYTTKSNGSGIGLSTASRIINAHNGLIDVISAPGHGTTMTMRVPV